jgi:hypothetical protein
MRFRSWRIGQALLHTHPSASIFPLPYTPWLQVLQITERFIMRPCLPYRHGNCVAAGLLGSPDITPVLRYYEPIHHRLAVSHFPGVAGYMTYPPPSISRWDEDGFSSCSACPCHRAVPNTPPECFIASVSLRRFMLPSPNRWGLGFRFKEFRGHLWVHFRYGPVTRRRVSSTLRHPAWEFSDLLSWCFGR